MYFWKSICLLALIASIQATQVKKCPKNISVSAIKINSSGKGSDKHMFQERGLFVDYGRNSARKLEPNEVTISSCPSKNKCVLKRNTKVNIEMKVNPTRDFNELSNNISGILLDVSLPFPGIYGTSACPHIYDAAGEKKVGCPLKAGQTYTYKNSFDILPVYPTVTLEIHCGLGDSQGDAACFQIPARIK